ncbi:hypothetical protein NGRA_2111 [Nosema granulosis]|uniref:Uncharacterized protein n=1 Tax=Nosema granulosis TaxID=83296 RepID=A0A9P6GY60_9MICR|nr:hypothetical protein NGRA_2111 [Nosema granulosis]
MKFLVVIWINFIFTSSNRHRLHLFKERIDTRAFRGIHFPVENIDKVEFISLIYKNRSIKRVVTSFDNVNIQAIDFNTSEITYFGNENINLNKHRSKFSLIRYRSKNLYCESLCQIRYNFKGQIKISKIRLTGKDRIIAYLKMLVYRFLCVEEVHLREITLRNDLKSVDRYEICKLEMFRKAYHAKNILSLLYRVRNNFSIRGNSNRVKRMIWYVQHFFSNSLTDLKDLNTHYSKLDENKLQLLCKLTTEMLLICFAVDSTVRIEQTSLYVDQNIEKTEISAEKCVFFQFEELEEVLYFLLFISKCYSSKPSTNPVVYTYNKRIIMKKDKNLKNLNRLYISVISRNYPPRND